MNDGLIDGRNLRVRCGEEINKHEGIQRLHIFNSYFSRSNVGVFHSACSLTF